MQCEVWSVESEDFASSLAGGKKNACRGKDTVGTGFSSNYRSFIFGKLPPPACPGTCRYGTHGIIGMNGRYGICSTHVVL